MNLSLGKSFLLAVGVVAGCGIAGYAAVHFTYFLYFIGPIWSMVLLFSAIIALLTAAFNSK